MAFVKVGEVGSVPEGEGILVEAEGKSIAIFRSDGIYYATENNCTHRGGPLCEGLLEGTNVICPWHGWEFDVATGDCLTNPKSRIDVYPLKVDGNDLLVDVGG